MDRIIVVDSGNTLKALAEQLKADGYDVQACGGGREAIDLFRQTGGGAMVLSNTVQDMTPMAILRELLTQEIFAPCIALSSTAQDAVEALRAGAYYAARPPYAAEELSLLVRRALRSTQATRQNGMSAAAALIGETPAIRAIRETINRLSTSPTTSVLVTGESGTGKDTVARAIHAATNGGGGFVHVTPSALPEQMLEAELFGVEAAASADGLSHSGLLERADAGTLFLDEVSDMPASLQAQLLRFVEGKVFRRLGAIEDRVSQARVVASTSRDIHAAVKNGTLRAELAYRLAVLTIELPPLRERRADIPLLVQHLLPILSARLERQVRAVSDTGLKLLVDYSWPGNVRELGNVLERAALLNPSEVLEAQHLSITKAKSSPVEYRLPPQGIDFRELEREVVVQALRLARGNQTRAASLLGMTRDQIRYRMAKFGMSSRDGNGAAA